MPGTVHEFHGSFHGSFHGGFNGSNGFLLRKPGADDKMKTSWPRHEEYERGRKTEKG